MHQVNIPSGSVILAIPGGILGLDQGMNGMGMNMGMGMGNMGGMSMGMSHRLQYDAPIPSVSAPLSSCGRPLRRKKKDPGAPKRPLSAYNIFFREMRPKVKDENRTGTFHDIARKLGEIWNSLPEEEKRPYIEAASQEKERYDAEMENYDQMLQTAYPADLNKPRRRKRRKKEPGAPTRPLSAYNIYFGEIRNDVKKSQENLSFGEIGKLIARRWKDLSVEEKRLYEERAGQDRQRYINEMKQYRPGWTEEHIVNRKRLDSHEDNEEDLDGVNHSPLLRPAQMPQPDQQTSAVMHRGHMHDDIHHTLSHPRSEREDHILSSWPSSFPVTHTIPSHVPHVSHPNHDQRVMSSPFLPHPSLPSMSQDVHLLPGHMRP